MTAKDRLEELIGPVSEYNDMCAECSDWDDGRNDLLYDQRQQIPTTQTQMLEDLKKAWPKKEATDDYDNYNGGYLNGHISGYNKALAEAWAVVEGYLGGEIDA